MDYDQAFRKKFILAILVVTGLIGNKKFNPPTKWINLIETFQISSEVFNSKLSCIDDDIQARYEGIGQKLGIESYYDPNYINQVKNEIEKESNNLNTINRGY